MELRVWYIDRVPSNKSTYVKVKNVKEAILVINTFIQRDLNDDRITDNAMGLQVWNKDDKEWVEYENKDGEDIDVIMEKKS